MEKIDRATGIGGSDMAAILGLSPYKTKFGVYCDKLGLTPPTEQTQRMRMGKILEPVVVKLFEEETGKKVSWSDETIRNAVVPWFIGSPDGFVHSKAGQYEGVDFVEDATAGFEAKTAGLDRAWEWGTDGDQVPEHYLVQVHHYMALTGLPLWYVAVLIGGDLFKTFEVRKDEEFASILTEEAEKFWKDHVEKQVPPDIDGSDAAKQYLRRRYPTALGEVRDATDVEERIMTDIAQLSKERKYITDQKEILDNRLREMIGMARGIKAENIKALWYDTKATVVPSYEKPAGRTLRVYPKKGAPDVD